jgi:UDP-N-acetylglucosamine acyltransferase
VSLPSLAMPMIHSSASVSAECECAPDVEIGPQCVLTGRVKLAAGVKLLGHVYVNGPVEIGASTIVYPFACIGFPGQDFKFKLGDTTAGVVIGSDCLLREHVTIHAATKADVPTRLGNRVFMMAGSHIGHDACVGNNVIMVNNSCVGGHGQLDDGCTLSGGALVHQFCRVGRLAFISGGSAVSTNVPPFCTAFGRNTLVGINLVGLRRSGVPRDQVTQVRAAYREVLRQRGMSRQEMVDRLRERGRECPPVMELASFVAESKRPICPGRASKAGEDAQQDEFENV